MLLKLVVSVVTFLSLQAAMGNTAAAPVMAKPELLSFKVWKTMRVDEAKANLERIQIEATRIQAGVINVDTRGIKSGVRSRQKIEQEISQAKMNVEINQDLTVNDYFILYLGQFQGPEALVEAAKKLSPEEIAELLGAYRRHLTGPDQAREQLPRTLPRNQAGL